MLQNSFPLDGRADAAIAQPSGHYKGADISYDAGTNIWRVVNYRGNQCVAKGANSSETGTLMVHLIDDLDANGNKVYCPVSLQANSDKGILFDEIAKNGTTINLSNLTVWL